MAQHTMKLPSHDANFCSWVIWMTCSEMTLGGRSCNPRKYCSPPDEKPGNAYACVRTSTGSLSRLTTNLVYVPGYHNKRID